MNKIIKQYRPKDNSTRELLRAVYNLLKDPKHWTQHVLATDKNGTEINYSEKQACSWCLSGAILALYNTNKQRNEAFDVIELYIGDSVANFNDRNDHKNVINMLKKVKG